MRRLHYGWVMVIISAIIMGVFAARIYTFGVFLVPLSKRFDWSRGAISLAATSASVISGLVSLLAGTLCDRYGPRTIVITAVILQVAGFLLATQITALWQLYLIWGLLMGTGNAFSYIPIMSTIARWFTARRTTALGITIAGFAAGAIIWPPLTQWVIDFADWQWAFFILGAATAIIIIPLAFMLKTSPSSAGLQPYGHQELPKPQTGTATADAGLTLRESTRTSHFWLWMFILFCFYTTLNVLFVHIVAHAQDIGVPPIVAAATLSIIAGCSIIARVTVGTITDKIDTRIVLAVALALAVVAFALLVISSGLWAFYLFAVIFGLAYGSFVPLETAVPAGLFGLKSLGAVMATAGLLSAVGGALGPPIAGAIFDATGHYLLAFIICLALVTIGLILSIILLRAKEKPGARS